MLVSHPAFESHQIYNITSNYRNGGFRYKCQKVKKKKLEAEARNKCEWKEGEVEEGNNRKTDGCSGIFLSTLEQSPWPALNRVYSTPRLCKSIYRQNTVIRCRLLRWYQLKINGRRHEWWKMKSLPWKSPSRLPEHLLELGQVVILNQGAVMTEVSTFSCKGEERGQREASTPAVPS